MHTSSVVASHPAKILLHFSSLVAQCLPLPHRMAPVFTRKMAKGGSLLGEVESGSVFSGHVLKIVAFAFIYAVLIFLTDCSSFFC